VTRKGNRYYVVVDVGIDDAGKRQRKWHSGYNTKRAAEAALAEIVTSLNAGVYVPPNKQTFGEYLVDEWLPAIKASTKASTWDSYRRTVQSHLMPRVGPIPLQAVSPGHLNALYAELLDGGRVGGGSLSPKTVRNVHVVVRKALGDAVSWNYVVRNAAASARPPRLTRTALHEHNTWSVEELRAFLDAVQSDRLYAAWIVAATTGMRRAEVLGLRWRDLDFAAGRIGIRQTLVSVAYELRFESPKTSRSRRSVSLDSSTVEALRKHRLHQAEERLAWGESYLQSGLVFCREDGSPVHPERFTQMFDRHVRRQGLRRIRLHDLRHTHATLALQAGVPAKVVSDRLGHSSVAFTLDVYSHVVPGLQEDAAQRVADLVFGV
jgi:integrase